MKNFLTLIFIFTNLLLHGQCFIPVLSREAKKIEIGVDLLQIHTTLNLVDDMTEFCRTETSKIIHTQTDENNINQKVSKFLSRGLLNTKRFDFKMLELLRMNNDSVKYYCPMLYKKVLNDDVFYCDGQIYLENNVAIKFPVILDNSYNIILADSNKISKLQENNISICESYSRLINSDPKTSLLDVVKISKKTTRNHSYLIFELTNYRLTGIINGDQHHYTQYLYQVDMLNGKVELLKRENIVEYICG